MLKSNVKKVKKHNFKKKLAGKFVFHETKKWAVCNVNREPFDKWECFFLGILSLNMLKSNVKRVKKHNFKKKFAGKFVFHKTKKKWSVCDINCEPFDKWECFVSGNLLLKMLNWNMKKLKGHNFSRVLTGKQIFHQTKMTWAAK